MLTFLQAAFDDTERQRAAVINTAQALTDAQRVWTPNADTWSVRQIVEHLVLSDEVFRADYTADAVPLEPAPLRVLPRALRRALVLAAFRRDMTLPLPSADIEPGGNDALPTLVARWAAARTDMKNVLDTLTRDEARWSHPVLGPLTATQMLLLSRTHTGYHARQLATLLSQTSFPSAVP